MSVKEVPTLGWTRGSVAASIVFVTQRQRDEMAARIRQEMSRQGLTNSRLARKADIAEKTVSRAINARRDPRIDTVERIAKALGISTEYLLGPPPPPLGLDADSDGQAIAADGSHNGLAVDARLARIEDMLAWLVLAVAMPTASSGQPQLPGPGGAILPPRDEVARTQEAGQTSPASSRSSQRRRAGDGRPGGGR